jgi:hypothetical protein
MTGIVKVMVEQTVTVESCPFCGQDKQALSDLGRVRCVSCNAIGPDGGLGTPIDLWNKAGQGRSSREMKQAQIITEQEKQIVGFLEQVKNLQAKAEAAQVAPVIPVDPVVPVK